MHHITISPAPPKATACCSIDSRWEWVEQATEYALSGSDTDKDFLPVLIDHMLGATRCLTGWEAEIVLAWVAHCQPGHESRGCRYCGAGS